MPKRCHPTRRNRLINERAFLTRKVCARNIAILSVPEDRDWAGTGAPASRASKTPIASAGRICRPAAPKRACAGVLTGLTISS